MLPDLPYNAGLYTFAPTSVVYTQILKAYYPMQPCNKQEFAAVMVDHIVPPYRALMESYDKAQNVQKEGRETKLDHLEAART